MLEQDGWSIVGKRSWKLCVTPLLTKKSKVGHKKTGKIIKLELTVIEHTTSTLPEAVCIHDVLKFPLSISVITIKEFIFGLFPDRVQGAGRGQGLRWSSHQRVEKYNAKCSGIDLWWTWHLVRFYFVLASTKSSSWQVLGSVKIKSYRRIIEM